jgi:hypothetical protein
LHCQTGAGQGNARSWPGSIQHSEKLAEKLIDHFEQSCFFASPEFAALLFHLWPSNFYFSECARTSQNNSVKKKKKLRGLRRLRFYGY